MNKLINVEKSYNEMRIDRFVRNYLGKIPQGLIEKSLRSGNIKINKKNIKRSNKVNTCRLYTSDAADYPFHNATSVRRDIRNTRHATTTNK